MLEPLYTCNLACIGCAVERHTGKLKDRLSLERCLQAADDCGAPVVSICGGEPTMYPELPELVDGADRAPTAHLPVHERAAARRDGVRQDRARTSA